MPGYLVQQPTMAFQLTARCLQCFKSMAPTDKLAFGLLAFASLLKNAPLDFSSPGINHGLFNRCVWIHKSTPPHRIALTSQSCTIDPSHLRCQACLVLRMFVSLKANLICLMGGVSCSGQEPTLNVIDPWPLRIANSYSTLTSWPLGWPWCESEYAHAKNWKCQSALNENII